MNTNILEKAVQTLHEVESTLANLAGEASSAKDYEAASAVLHLAMEVRDLAAQASRLDTSGIGQDRNRRRAATGRCTRSPKGTTSRRTSSVRRRKSGYPRFRREGDVLVKIGWSKAEKDEYQHKAPKLVLEVLVHKLAAVAVDGSIVTMEEILPLRDSDGTELPAYQAYVCLAWLKSIGGVKQHGRQGYSINNIRAAFAAQWGRMG